MDQTAPVVVAGAGPVGSTLALALAASGIDVVLAACESGATDERPIALSVSSIRILETLGVWQHIAAAACPIRTVHVSEKGRFGMVRLHAREHGVDALGYVVPAFAIQRALDAALAATPGLHRIADTQVRNATLHGDGIAPVAGPGEPSLPRARLLVVAEGGSSALLQSLGVVRRETDYRQSAVVGVLAPGRAHQNTAYERFTGNGPLALLPLASGDCALVWTLPDDEARRVTALDDEPFLAAVQQEFGHRLGVLREAGPRSSFPLALVQSEAIALARVALVGNAANRLHPVAGQGLNLGLRDVAALAELVAPAVREGRDAGAPDLLDQFSRSRRSDQRGVVRFTDLLARGFSVSAGPLGAARSLAMLSLDLAPPLGRALARRAMGLSGRQPRLVRGVMP